MDAFYASVEQRDFPELKDRPVIVGGSPDRRGVVAACSYEARRFGIHSAMPSSRAYRLCPHAVFRRHRFDVYRQVSSDIAEVFREFTDKIEPLSLDEAYLDVSDCDRYQGSATRIARAIKERIRQRTELTASAGVSYNKFLAKMASDMDKPDGLYVILPDQGMTFVEELPIGKFYGIGKATETKMKVLGIHRGRDLKAWSKEKLLARFGKVGSYYYNIARGIDERPVVTSRERKSLGTETTFETDLEDRQQMLAELAELAAKVAAAMQKRELSARTLTLKVKYADFTQVTRSQTLEETFDDAGTMQALLPDLLARTKAGERAVRLLGVTASNFVTDIDSPDQITLI